MSAEDLIKIKTLDQEITLGQAKQIYQELGKLLHFMPKETYLYEPKSQKEKTIFNTDMSKMSYN